MPLFRTLILLSLMALSNASAQAQLTYIGLGALSNVRTAQSQSTNSITYWPNMQVLDGYIYVPTYSGLYRKSLATLQDTTWQLYAFGGYPIRTFAKKGDTVLAATDREAGTHLLLRSTDNGRSFTDHTSPVLLNNQGSSLVIRMGQNPRNPNSLVILNQRSGILKSTDFGNTWTQLNPFLGGYQDWFAQFNPNDTSNILYTGEQIFFQSYIQATYDNGATWKKVDSLQTHCTHGIAFHPTDKNRMVAYGEGRLTKSTDQGRSWTTVGTLPVYLYKSLYDPQNPDLVYATGDVQGVDDTLQVFRSTDGGDHWSLFYRKQLPDADGIVDMGWYQNKLILYTMTNGVYILDATTQQVTNPSLPLATVYPNPTRNRIQVQSAQEIKAVTVYDGTGKRWMQEQVQGNTTSLDLQALPVGTYQLVVQLASGSTSIQVSRY
ncbi:MAG: T9SS type A sorting domain-containing protein [Sphingobacteriales bacterium]|nr:MAG: T9SS type A sorting domain-containing protein [Sphingobacteriales bacterium]